MGGKITVLPKEGKFRLVDTQSMPAAPGPVRSKLPITEVIQKLNVRLAGTITIAGGAADGVLAPEGTLGLIRDIEIRGTSSSRREVGRIKFADIPAYYRLNQFLRGGVVGELVSLAGAGVQAGTPVSFDVQLDFEMPWSSDPRQTLLNTTELTSLDLIATWGNKPDLVSAANDRTFTFPTMAMKINAEEFTDLESKTHRYGIHSFNYIEVNSSLANSRMLIDLKRGYLLRGFLVKQFTRAAGVQYHTPVNTNINSIALELNREVRIGFDDWPLLQADNQYHYRIITPPVGYAFIDLMKDGRYDNLVDTRRYRDVNVVINCAALADAYIRIYPVEIIPSVL